MPKALKCPSCGAPLHNEQGQSPVIRCSYCSTMVILPPELAGVGQAGQELASTVASKKIDENHQAFIAGLDRCLKSGNKIQAIRIYKEYYQVGLKEAKDAVENLEGQEIVPGTLRTSPVQKAARAEPEVKGNAIELITSGKKIEAIKLLRETYDLSLKTAKEAADALESGQEIDIELLRLQNSRQSTQQARAPYAEHQTRTEGFSRRRTAHNLLIWLAIIVSLLVGGFSLLIILELFF
jgi:LSD1 subclass zinc finger protein